MSAKTKWWLCGKCGYANRPRGRWANSLNRDVPEFHDNTKCEQCGAGQDELDAADYTPGAR